MWKKSSTDKRLPNPVKQRTDIELPSVLSRQTLKWQWNRVCALTEKLEPICR
jgi:hypothetical protein